MGIRFAYELSVHNAGSGTAAITYGVGLFHCPSELSVRVGGRRAIVSGWLRGVGCVLVVVAVVGGASMVQSVAVGYVYGGRRSRRLYGWRDGLQKPFIDVCPGSCNFEFRGPA